MIAQRYEAWTRGAGWCLLVVILGCGAESSSGPPTEPAMPEGKWRPARSGAPSEDSSAEGLKAVPYLQGYRPARDESSVSLYRQGLAFDGLNLYVSGHGAEAALMTMDGTVRHRWRSSLRRVWPDLAPTPELAKLEYWRRAYLYPNGDLLAIFETQGLIKVDASSRLLWAYRSDVHHDLFVDPAGQIWVLDRRARRAPRLHPEKPILEDLVTILSPEGAVKRQISLISALESSPYRSWLVDRPVRHGDIFHTNTLERLDGSLEGIHPAFAKGNLLLSFFQLNAVAVVDPRQARVVWGLSGLWRKQHQPVLLPAGRLLVFDNLGPGGRRSRVLETDVLTQQEVWHFGGETEEQLYSKTLGSVQRLANGNTLITESENGRALEVLPSGDIVWEFHNPHRAGEDGELVATLFEVLRLPAEFPFQGE